MGIRNPRDPTRIRDLKNEHNCMLRLSYAEPKLDVLVKVRDLNNAQAHLACCALKNTFPLQRTCSAGSMTSDVSISSLDGPESPPAPLEADATSVEKPSTSSASEDSEQFAQRSLYCLALVNSETGDAVRPVTDEEAEEIARTLSSGGQRSKAHLGMLTSASATPTSRQNSTPRPKPGGPCNNCGVMDSPQWRRGPPIAPVLCNACGTRYRRTSQLATGGLRALKRAAEAQKQQQALKHPKPSPLVACTV